MNGYLFEKKLTLATRSVVLTVLLAISFSCNSENQQCDNPEKALSQASSLEYKFQRREFKHIPVLYRTDGYSKYCHKTLVPTRKGIEQELIVPLAKGGISTIGWGCNAGTTATHDSVIEPIVGAMLTPQEWKQMRELDFVVYTNLKTMIDSGNDPLKVAIASSHKLGMKIFGRLEMSRGYGNVKKKSWSEILLNGKFSKEHPEYRIPGRLHLDFKYKAVRDYKLALLREMAEKGCDGIMADFVSNPIYFAEPEKGRPVMTQFVRDIRNMLDEVGIKQNRKIELFIRVNYKDSYQRGLDWQLCMKEGLIDYISTFKGWPASDYFNYNIDEFVAYRDKIKSKCKVYGHIWQALGLIDTDSRPNSKKRYSKPKTVGMYIAQAALHNLAGCDGLELGFASPQQWRSYYGALGTPEKIEFADKHYMADIKTYMPLVFSSVTNEVIKKVKLRVADNVAKAQKLGLKVNAEIILTSRALSPGEKLVISINDKGTLKLNGDSSSHRNTFISSTDIKSNSSHTTAHKKSFLNDPNWYKRGQSKISFPTEWLKPGENSMEFCYTDSSAENSKDLEIRWVELTVEYSPKQGISADIVKEKRLEVQSKNLELIKNLFNGKIAVKITDLEAYTGKNAVNAIVGKWRKAAYLENYNQLSVNYGDNVDFQLRKRQIILCPQTTDLLYSPAMIPKMTYKKGSRPALENIVAEITHGCGTEKEKVLAIMRFCRDLKNKPTKKWGPGFIFGGKEEYLIEKGEDLCEVLGRLFLSLCEIAEIPVRIVMHDIGGHITAEAYIDGHWGYIDPKTGLYFLKTNGLIASVWDIMLYPAIMNKQTAKVQTDLHSKYKWDKRVEKCREKYFNIMEINGFEYYSLSDREKYNYETVSWETAVDNGFKDIGKKYHEAISHVFK